MSRPTITFINNVKEFARANHIRIGDLERHAGRCRGYLSRLELTEYTSVPLDLAVDMAEQIGVPLETLLKEASE